MGLHTQEATGRYLSVVAGKLREKVEEGTPGAQKREGEVAGTPFEKWELIYPGITGMVTKVTLQDGKFGKNVHVHFTDENNEEFIVSLGADNSRTGVPMLEALPNLDLTKEVTLKPYKFTNDNGENVEGMKITQEGEKVYSAFFDPKAPEGEKQKLGMPAPQPNKKGEVNWKLYFAQRDEWLQEYVVENGYATEGEDYTPEQGDEESNQPAEKPF